jgi:hypothetical protein
MTAGIDAGRVRAALAAVPLLGEEGDLGAS